MHKVGNIGISLLFKFENDLDIVNSLINFISKEHGKNVNANIFH